jgi:hypothetical protein
VKLESVQWNRGETSATTRWRGQHGDDRIPKVSPTPPFCLLHTHRLFLLLRSDSSGVERGGETNLPDFFDKRIFFAIPIKELFWIH